MTAIKECTDKQLVSKARRLIRKLRACDEAYFNESRRIVSDARYDWQKEHVLPKVLREMKRRKLAQWKKVKAYLDETGTAVKFVQDKRELPVYMPSLNKVKTDQEQKLVKWLSRVLKEHGTFSVALSSKLDGSSLMVEYKKGKLVSGMSRGDGTTGTNITTKIQMLQKLGCLPKEIGTNKHVFIRGELAISEQVFKSRFEGKEFGGKVLKESRNAANGFVNSTKSPNKTLAQNLMFMAYDCFTASGEDAYETKKLTLKKLHKWGFQTFYTDSTFQQIQIRKESDIARVIKLLNTHLKVAIKQDETGECFAIKADGAVIEIADKHIRDEGRWYDKAHRPTYAVAYKIAPTDEVNQIVHKPKTKEVTWEVSKSGELVPSVWYTKPVPFGNTLNAKATGVHAANIIEKGIGPGTVLKVVRSGNVIPRILSTKPDTRLPKSKVLPKRCPSCGSKTVMISTGLYCSKPDECPTLVLNRIVHAVKKLKIDGLAKGKIEKLFDAGVLTSVKALFSLTPKQILKVDGFGEKSAKSIVEQIAAKREKLTDAQLAVVSGIFVQPRFSLSDSVMPKMFRLYEKHGTIKAWKATINPKKGPSAAEQCFFECIGKFERWQRGI